MSATQLAILQEVTEIILVPRLDYSNQLKIAKWHKQVGDYVKVGDVLATMESFDAFVDLETSRKGVILYKGGEEGDSLGINEVLLVIGIC
jgi:pyruvate/2-oxoglutarate dehydrogenase complex dihydrolipoamide acyltransferase (E2) component